MDLEFGDYQEVEDAEGLVILMNNHRPTRRGPGQKVRVLDDERATIAHVNRVRPEGSLLMHVGQLLDGHGMSVPPSLTVCWLVNARV